MRIEQLYYFIQVAESSSISKTAKNLHITQQGLSHAIKSLEIELGVTLFNRGINKISLTKAGEQALIKAKDTIHKYEELLLSIEPYLEIEPNYVQGLNVFTTPLMSRIFLKKVLYFFSKKHPQVNINIIEQPPLEVPNKIIRTNNAIGILSIRKFALGKLGDFENPNLCFQKLAEYGAFALIGKTSPLANEPILNIETLIREPIAIYNAGQQLATIRHLFQNIGEPNFKVITTDWELYENSIASGEAIGIGGIPDNFSEDHAQKRLIKNVPIKTNSKFDMILYCVTSNKGTFNPLIKDFINSLQNFSKRILK